jgi:hypothetical protein
VSYFTGAGLDLDVAARRLLRHRRHRNVGNHTAGPEHGEGFEAHVAADQVEHQIDILEGGREVGLGVVDYLVGAERADEIDVLRSRRRRDPGAEMLGQLHGKAADAAGAGVNEHALAARDLPGGDNPGPGAQARNGNRARLDIAQTRGPLRGRRRGHRDKFGERAPARRVGDTEHLVARLEIRHGAAGLDDRAGAIAAQHMRQLALRGSAVALGDLAVDRVDACRFDLHQHVIRPGHGRVDVADAQRWQSFVAVEQQRFHDVRSCFQQSLARTARRRNTRRACNGLILKKLRGDL